MAQTFGDHLAELRNRLGFVFLVFAVTSIIAYIFHAQLIIIFQKPLNQPLYYTTPAGNFNFIVKISCLCGLIACIPIFLYNAIKFITPIFPKQVGRHLLLFVTFGSVVFASLGALFGYYILLPLSLHFFQSFSSNQLQPLISTDAYLNYFGYCLLTTIIIFMTPLLLLGINFITPLPPRKLLRYQWAVILGSLALAIVLPFTYDPITQFVFAVPIIFFYYLSILLIMIINALRRPRAHKQKIKRPKSQPKTSTKPIIKKNSAPLPQFQALGGKTNKKIGPAVIDLREIEKQKSLRQKP